MVPDLAGATHEGSLTCKAVVDAWKTLVVRVEKVAGRAGFTSVWGRTGFAWIVARNAGGQILRQRVIGFTRCASFEASAGGTINYTRSACYIAAIVSAEIKSVIAFITDQWI